MLRKICVSRGCDELAEPGGSHCADHLARIEANKKASREKAKLSPEAKARARLYSTAAWRTARDAYLKQNPMCVHCDELGLWVEATDVDHIEPIRINSARAWDRTNWQGLCHSCHSRKTARERLAGRKKGGVF